MRRRQASVVVLQSIHETSPVFPYPGEDMDGMVFSNTFFNQV